MILCFSANGNSRWVAEQLAKATGDDLFDISGNGHQSFSLPVESLRCADVVGLVFPVHSWRAPWPLLAFLITHSFPGCRYRYAVCTCGDDAGRTMNHLSRYFLPDAAWSVIMPNTYIPMFDLDDVALARQKVAQARCSIHSIASDVLARKKTWQVHEGSAPWLKTYLVHPLFARFVVSSRGFRVDEGCVSCGTCVKVCPQQNVRLVAGRPQWGRECIHCMACVHACPHRVIQYRKATQRRGRYRLSDYLSDAGEPSES